MSPIPDGIHLMLNLTHEPVVDEYLRDVGAAIEEAGRRRSTAPGGVVASY